MIIADDLLFGIKYLTNFHGDLRLLKGGGQILDVVDGGADADNCLDIMFALQGIHNGSCQLFHIAGIVIRADFFHQHGICFADVEHEVFLFIREQAADHIISGNIIAGGNADQQNHALHIRNKVQLPRFGVNITGQDIIQHHILDEIGFIKLFIVVLLDALQADGQQRSKLGGSGIVAFHKHSIIVMFCVGELVVGITVLFKGIPGRQAGNSKAFPHFADLPQLGAGDDGSRFVHHAYHAVDRVLHLVDHVLEYPVCHNTASPSCLYAN